MINDWSSYFTDLDLKYNKDPPGHIVSVRLQAGSYKTRGNIDRRSLLAGEHIKNICETAAI